MQKNKDVFILIPIDGKPEGLPVSEASDLGSDLLKVIGEEAAYECDELIAKSIERQSLGKANISYMDDDYDASGIEWLDMHITITVQKQTSLGIVMLFIPQCRRDVTQIGDMVSSGHIQIRADGKTYPVQDFIEQRYHVRICGKIRTVYCFDREEQDCQAIQYMLAGETDVSVHSHFKIKNDRLEALALRNLASYDFYDLYASPNAVVYCIDEFNEDSVENFEEEALLLFICEIAVLQNTALYRINRLIVEELMCNSNISPRKTLKLQIEFGKTILLWNNNIYNYYMAQSVSDRIIEAFGTKEMFTEYKRNKKHIEQIASLKSGIASEIEGKVLNFLALILSINELIQIVAHFRSYLSGISLGYGVLGGTSVTLIFVLILILRRRKIRHKGKN
ncbi:MAG: hypothetical protein K5697_08860 [Lachnospiraceae bacterium]|nr:hypothetical protein [Lachnospiraceae bacterium]